jgi:hypothetical protein
MTGRYYDDEVRKPALGEVKHRPRSKVRLHGMRGQGVRMRGIGCWRYTSCLLEIWIFVGEQAGWESSRVSSLDFPLSLLCSASLLCRIRTLFRLRSISSTRCSQAGSWKLEADISKIFSFVRRFLIPRVVASFMRNGSPRAVPISASDSCFVPYYV